ncbi:MAG: hypothetical protein A2087_14245 [Spirochaetes bacterium GWD1_61_31]|nr:MAG: hypothetical protein A2Y37_04135 [Spirochaetes bacterium GWB1_60_80]OHD30569.1 MAG: hypothetical protein A2004_05520 [Spirochaetes bacterium GWC1_61_12]OHD34837.1 MAG: hypothetical protein A2087_14245 [Spirochaetes bacterium GWD1_61_31]OHD46683.1 MAG: hypothetical protein A2Y35_11070 [Spirochaetes bacterium GWE1_60_18]OHD60312.1 MAG: hypothetical protein A2Y32_14635 [Spirochaetes bacterium GWF1_60_12]HAP44210.1 hybrid sensor histidine kinase/response regulator [Spirochaetaceae bacteriu
MQRIAVCEDETIVALDIERFLTRNQYTVSGLYSRAEDLLLAVAKQPPDLVLLDIHLAGSMDGLEAAALLHSQYGVPVILLTAYSDNATIERAKQSQPYAYVLKPFNDRELRTAIELALYRASMESRLRRSEQRYRSLFSAGLMPQCIVNAAGAVLETNAAFLELIAAEAYYGDLPTLLALPADRQLLERALATRGSLRNVELSLLVDQNKTRTVLLSLAPFSLEYEAGAFLCQALDITEKQELAQKLLQSQKMDALGKLASSVAHEFNNILTAILGFARMLESEIEGQVEAMAELEGIIRSTERATGLTKQLLMFARNDPVKAEALAPAAVCQDLELLLSRLVGKGIKIESRHQDEPMTVLADKLRLEQALLNLCLNARDAMSLGGTLRISSGLEIMPTPKRAIVQDIPAGKWAFISVADEGSGIQPVNLPKIFDPFFTTKPVGKGTGLGLSTVIGIVQSAHGYIDVASTPGQGSTFTVYLPLVSAQARIEA